MKKATNSKNRGKIIKLFQIMQEHFGKSMNLARIKLILICANLNCQNRLKIFFYIKQIHFSLASKPLQKIKVIQLEY